MTNETAAKGKLLLAMGIFGTIGLFVRLIPLSSGVIALARGVIGTLFLLAVTSLRKTRLSLPDVRRNLAPLLLSGAFLGLNWMLLFEAYRYTTVAVATLCYYLAPVIVILISPLVLKEKLTPVKAVCAAAALLGMALVSGAPQSGLPGGRALTGILLGVGAAVLYACIILLNKRLSGISSFDATIVQLAVSAAVMLPYVLLTGQAAAFSPTPAALLMLLAVGVVHTGIAYALYFGSIRSLRAQTVALFSYADPVAAILLSALLLHEPMDGWGALGAVLILGSTLVSELFGGRRRADAGETRP